MFTTVFEAKLTTGELNAKTLDEVDTVYQKLADKHGQRLILMLKGLGCGPIS